MCFIVKFSEYILVPILADWLTRHDLIKLSVSLVNCQDRVSFAYLMSEYSFLLHDKMLMSVSTDQELSLLGLCGWYRSFGLPVEVFAKVRICKYDVFLMKQFDWMESCTEVLNRVRDLIVAFNEDDIVSDDLMSCITDIKSVKFSCSINFSFSRCHFLKSIVVCVALTSQSEPSIAAMCRLCPLLESLELNCFLDNSLLISHAITVHCKNLKKLKCRVGERKSTNNSFIFAFHSVSNNLTDIDWDIDDGDKLLGWRTRWWYKGSKLTQLELYYDQMDYKVQSVMDIITVTCPSLCSLKLNLVSLMDDKFTAITNHLRHCLQGINFVDSTSTSIIMACKQCSVLRTLEISYGTKLTNGDLLTIAQYCPLLTSLTIECSGLSKGYLSLIAPYIAHLVELKLPTTLNTELSSKDCSILQSMKALKSLDCSLLPFSSLDMMCNVLEISSLISLKVEVRSKLRCHFGTSLSPVIAANLTTLNLSLHMNDDNFIALLSCCPHLARLHICRNDFVTIEGVRGISSYCKKLQSFTHMWCFHLKNLELKLIDVFPRLLN